MSLNFSTALALSAMPPRAPLMADGKTRRQLTSAFFLAVLGHAVVMLALAAAPGFRPGAPHVTPLSTRWVDAPPTARPSVAATPAAMAQTAQPPAPARVSAQAPSKAERRPAPHRPNPSTADSNEPRASARSDTDVADAAKPELATAAAALPPGDDPLRMLPTTPERFQVLDKLSQTIDGDPQAYAVGHAVSVEIEDAGKPRTWRFVVVGEDMIRSMAGRDVPVLHLVHYPEHEKDDRIEIWLTSELAHRPVQMEVFVAGVTTGRVTARTALDRLDRAVAPPASAASR
ncbi:DUF3108 domain-containing protein [Ottowia testudinis]|uniref:DUF3108 domain-containing protein n=1 Tax=Ottowia testudinis TaxID=2816950 RepID=A0A975CKD6_9BURK|nr:DUF3108 domain-containing protein [Ottowia testudinis]QTD45058.1 DUF3108 domain-containing protein [Ottowia testudinis]